MTETLLAEAGPDASTLGMVAVYPTADEAAALAVEGGLEVDDLHCTLVFLGETEGLDAGAINEAVAAVAAELAGLSGTIGGAGAFAETPDGVPVILLPDVKGLTMLREALVEALRDRGVESPSEHGFLPHMTLTYGDEPVGDELADRMGLPVTFAQVSVVFGDERVDYPLDGARVAAAVHEVASPEDVAEALSRSAGLIQSEAHIAPLARAYEEVFEGAGRRMANALVARSVILADADQQFVPPDPDEIIESIDLAEQISEIVAEAQKLAAGVVVAELAEDGVAYDVDTVFTEDLLERLVSIAVFGVEDVLRDILQDVLHDAAEAGDSVQTAADALQAKIGDVAPHTAHAMARTDLNALANGGSLHVAQIELAPQEKPVYKTWLATPDERTRDTHWAANGQTVPINENFTVGGFAMPYPGYPFAPPEEVINCRCTLTYTSDPTGAEQVIRAGGQPPDDLPFPGSEPEEAPMGTTTDDTTAPPAEALAADGNGEIDLTPLGWDAVLAVEDEPTEDGRLLVRGSTGWRDLPLSLMGMLETSDYGHVGAKVAGRIDSITRVSNDIASAGELTSKFGISELAPLIADRTVRGVSVDLAVLDWEYRDRETGQTLTEDDLFMYWLEGKESQVLFAVLEGVIVGATVCPMPAIANAEISLAASAGLDGPARAILADALGERRTALADVPLIRVFTPFDRARSSRPLVAAAPLVELAPASRHHFERTEFPGKTPLTVGEPGDDGWRPVFGHIATWDTCHVGIPGVCTTAPRSYTTPPYALFHQAQYLTSEGDTLDVGSLMLGTGHAGLAASRMEATRHYDKPDMVGARVRAVDGEFGIWVSGVARAELTDAGLRELRENPPSGDWRSYNGHLELIAVCAVAVPGFPVVADAQANLTASSGEVGLTALIASSGTITPTDTVRDAMVAAGCACDDIATSDDSLDDIAELALS